MSTATITKEIFGSRFRRSLSRSFWPLPYLAKQIGLPSAMLRLWLTDREKPLFESMVVAVAELLEVDPRWLATGEMSAAGQEAVAEFNEARARGSMLSDRGAAKAMQILEVLPQPPGPLGVCRYCHATDVDWVDDECTICVACIKGR
jgi:hypothetical protein